MSHDHAGLLTAYADGQLAEADRLAVEAALANSPELRAQLEEIRVAQTALRTLPAAPTALREVTRERLLQRVQHAWCRPQPKPKRMRWMLPYAAAAGVMLVVGGVIVISGTTTYEAHTHSRSEMAPVLAASSPPPPATFGMAGKKEIDGFSGTFSAEQQRLDVTSPALAMEDVADEGAMMDAPAQQGREEALVEAVGGSSSFMAIGAGGSGRQVERKRKQDSDKLRQVYDNKDAQVLPSRPLNEAEQSSLRAAVTKPNASPAEQGGRLQERAAKSVRAALPVFPSQSPSTLASQLANIAPSPLLAADPALRLRNLAEQYQLPLTLPSQRFNLQQALPTAPGLSAGEQVVMMANRAGAQVVMANGRIAMQTPVVLDPTDRLGLDVQAFTAAWGTPPMAIVAQDARQTFALDADSASFDRARAELDAGRLPDPAGLRPEHFINAVPADYPRPVGHEAFSLFAEAGPSLFARGPNASRQVQVAVGVVGRAVDAGERRPLHLVVAIDASGSMARSGALDRARIALDGLVDRLGPADRIAVIAFGERGRVVLPATPATDPRRLREAFTAIETAGATNTAEGLALATQMAREMAAPGAALRVVLVTDGAAIAGPEEAEARTRVAALRAVGGSLLILGVGEHAADTRALDSLVVAGDGQQIHLGSDADARRVVDQALLPARLEVLARDAKAQVTWNPERVTHARLVGYERRRLDHAAFRDDRVDAGELPSTTVVTALFEVVLAEGGSGPLGTASVRYFDTRMESVRELACPMPGSILAPQASPRLRTLACAAELAEQLRGSWWANVRPTAFRSIAAACAGLPAPADTLARMANQAEALRPLIEVRP